MVNIILIIIILVLLSERIAKIIPDSKTGFLGIVRKVFKVVAGYTENVR